MTDRKEITQEQVNEHKQKFEQVQIESQDKPKEPLTPKQIKYLQDEIDRRQEMRATYKFHNNKVVRVIGRYNSPGNHRTKDCVEYMNNKSNLKLDAGFRILDKLKDDD